MWIYEQTKPEENFSLLPQVASLPFRLYRHRQLNRQSN